LRRDAMGMRGCRAHADAQSADEARLAASGNDLDQERNGAET